MRHEDHPDVENFAIGWHEKLSQYQKDTMLLLKYILSKSERYPNEFHSAEIYRAVKSGVNTIDGLWKAANPYY